MLRLRFTHTILLSSLLLSALLLWFVFANCRSALPVAHCYLRGLALSLGQAIESIAIRDTSLKLLGDFKSNDIAYFAVIGRDGRIRFHSNPDLINEPVDDLRYKPVLDSPIVTEERLKLGTGEVVFESQQQMHLAGGPLVLRLVLHTWQADQIIRRSRVGGGMILLLLAASWGFGLWTLHLQKRELQHRDDLARQEHLAQLGKLGAVLAHEVRTPLAGIKGFAQLLGERLEEPRQQGYIEKIVGESERLEELVSDLLTYARQEPLPKGRVTATEAVQGAWENLVVGARQVGVVLQLTGSIGRPIACSPDRLRQVLLNLFSNALQAMPQGGELQVMLSSVQDRAQLLIIDSGPGFSAESLTQAFVPFYTTRPSGSGLGMAVCRKIVEGYNGTISAANSSRGGAEITIQLPMIKELL
jgi:two-component system sensor histidine kinase HydH